MEGPNRCLRIHEWSHFERMGTPLDTSITQTLIQTPSGSIEIHWSVNLGGTPLTGTSRWDPTDPHRLLHHVQGSAQRWVDLPPNTLLWPEAIEAALRRAAERREPLSLRGFSAPLGQPTELELVPETLDPLPGFPDTVRFRGRTREGLMTSDSLLWISPTQGEIQETSQLGGLSIRLQREELPPPAETHPSESPFENTLTTLPAHPLLPWLPEVTLRWRGPGEQRLPEDPQQTRLGPNRFRIRRASPPSTAEAADPPLRPPFDPAVAPYLVPTSLLPYEDPAFEGVLKRLKPRPGASRWELTQAVTHFVFEWIETKDFTVGFGTALDVLRHPQGDCTEHTVLAVALLRRLGVPARGVTGWVAAGRTFGLHLWVEVLIGNRWIPVDPTFDETPASALHLKLATTDLSDLGSVGWDTASTRVAGGRWEPDPDWPPLPTPRGERLPLPGGGALRLREGHWQRTETSLRIILGKPIAVEAVHRPSLRSLEGATVLEDPSSGRRAWWFPRRREAFLRLTDDRWLLAHPQDIAQVQRLLAALAYEP